MAADTAPSDALSREAVFRRVVVPEIEVMYGVARRLTGSPHDAEDVVQETLLRAYRAIDRFDGRHPRAWLLTILRNANRNRVRRRVPDLLDDEWAALAVLPARGADGREGAAESALEHLAAEAVLTALRTLSVDHRAVLALVDVDGLSYREAADVLDVPVGTVMSRLHRARAALRRGIGRTDLGEDRR